MKKTVLSILLGSSLLFGAEVGDKAFGFTLPKLYDTSKQISSDQLKGKVILLNIWASWCGGCKKEMPLLVALQKEFAKENFQLLLVNIDEERSNAIEFLDETDPKHIALSLYDKSKLLPNKYKAIGMPSSYLIDKNGNIALVIVGSLDEDNLDELKEKIRSLLRG